MKKTFLVVLFNFVFVNCPLRILSFIFRPVEVSRNKFILIPADPMAPDGSFGDIAMLWGLHAELKLRDPNVEIVIVGRVAGQVKLSDSTLCEVVPAWRGWAAIWRYFKLLEHSKGVILMGADVLDGKYSPNMVIRAVYYCLHCFNRNKEVHVLGFSFNADPSRLVIPYLKRLAAVTKLKLRDRNSYERFKVAVSSNAELVADTAFLMRPQQPDDGSLLAWISRERSRNRRVVGLNVNEHAMSKALSSQGYDSIIAGIADRVNEWIVKLGFSMVLIPHDAKPAAGDMRFLLDIYERITLENKGSVTLAQCANPAQVKSVSRYLDLVISGRMHLAIASLSQGTPVIAITYQGKFEGLYDALEQSQKLLVKPELFYSEIDSALDYWLTSDLEIRRALKASIPEVERLARENIPDIRVEA